MRASLGDSGLMQGVSRRRALEIGIAVLLAAASAAAVVRTRGYPGLAGRRLTSLSTWQFVVARHAARRVTASDREGTPSVPTADDLDIAGFMDRYLGLMTPNVRRDFGRFLAYLEHLAPVRSGFVARFTRLRAEDQDRVLAALEGSSSDLLRAGFDGLKSLCLMGYYRDPRTWSLVGYDGPLVGRPSAGWSAGFGR